MKLWLKYLIGASLGAILGLFLPLNGGDTEVFFVTVNNYVLHIGRYLVFPLVFFGLVISSYELWMEKKFLPLYGRMMGYSMLSAGAASVIAAVFVAVFSPERVPIIIEETEVRNLPGFGEQLTQVFPKNLFSIFSNSGDFLLPVFIFAILLGLGLLYNRSISAPVVDIFESLSRVVFSMNRIMLEILSVGIFFMTAYRTTQLRGMADLELFSQLLLVVLGAALFVIFALLPGIVFLLGDRKRNPYAWLFSAMPTALSSLLSGDMYYTLGSAIGVAGENMRINRKASYSAMPLGAIFSRSGTALVTTISFILILRSYSSLDISLLQYLWIMGSSILISFMLGTVPGNAMVVSLSVISTWYGQGLEEGFLILLPIAPILTSIAVLLDVMVVLMNTQLVADHESLIENASVREMRN